MHHARDSYSQGITGTGCCTRAARHGQSTLFRVYRVMVDHTEPSGIAPSGRRRGLPPRATAHRPPAPGPSRCGPLGRVPRPAGPARAVMVGKQVHWLNVVDDKERSAGTSGTPPYAEVWFPPPLGAVAAVAAAVLLLTCSSGFARTITVVSYNVQNLFDATDDGGEYRQFTRAGGWTSDLYSAKLRAIGSALRAAAPGGADLVALQEVEHYAAARRLLDQELGGLGYRHVVWLPDPHNPTGPVVLSKLPVRRVGALWVDGSSPG